MQAYYSDVIEFKGNHYDFGYQQGKLLRESPILFNREIQWKHRRAHHFTIDPAEATQLFERFLPRMIDELYGLADALQLSFETALRDFGGYYIEYERSGCSIFTGDQFMIRNYDADPAYYEGRYLIYQPTDGGYATIGPSMQITGRTDGMNEKGLAMGYNFINRRNTENGFLCNMIGRILLESCATTEEAIDVLKELPHRTSFNYALNDASGHCVVVEASPREVIARPSTISTNHFELLLKENRYRMDDSKRRQMIMTREEKNTRTAYDAFQLLNDPTYGIFGLKYGASAGTIHTAAYLPKEMKAFFAIGSKQAPVIYDFGAYIAGAPIHVTKMKGKLAYKLPFVNMEKMTPST